MLYTRESGSPSHPPIVFLHGGGLSSVSWQPVMERLPDFYCLAPDLPGHGQSKDMPIDIDRSADLVADLIRERLPGCKASVVGLSYGGAVTLSLLRAAPELIDHAIISGSSAHVAPWLTKMNHYLTWTYSLFSKDYLMQATFKQHGIPPEYQDLVYADILAGSDPAFITRLADSLSTWTLPKQITVPLLILVGEREPTGSLPISRGYRKRFPSAQGAVVPGARHAWFLQFPNLFAETVRAWINNQPLPVSFKPL